MPLKLNVGVSRKVGLPDYSSVGATCNLDLELDQSLLEADPDGFHARVRGAYVAARRAVDDELARLRGRPAVTPPDHDIPANGHGSTAAADPAPQRPAAGRGRPARAATPSQVRAILAIARNQHADLAGVLRQEFGVDRPEGLSVGQASALIDRLRQAAAV